jgi:hypothetical protein
MTKTTGHRLVEESEHDRFELIRRIDQALETANAEVERLTKDRDALVKALELVNERLLKGLEALVEKETS